MMSENPLEDPLPITPGVDGHSSSVATKGSCDMTDALFSPDGMADKQTVPVTTEQTQLLFTTEVRLRTVCKITNMVTFCT